MENLSICAKCGGRCCKNYPGIFKPEELKDNFIERIGKDLVIVADIQVSPDVAKDLECPPEIYKELIPYWDSLKRIGYVDDNTTEIYILAVRPKAITDVSPVNAAVTYKGKQTCTCSLWDKDSGCPLSHEERPWECKNLIPQPTFACDYGDIKNSKEFLNLELVEAWKPYQDKLWDWIRGHLISLGKMPNSVIAREMEDDDSMLMSMFTALMDKGWRV